MSSEASKGPTPNLRLNDIVNLTKTRDRDLENLNERMNKKNVHNVFTFSEGININEYKKAKKAVEDRKKHEEELRSQEEHLRKMRGGGGTEEQAINLKSSIFNLDPSLKINYDDLKQMNHQERFLELFKCSIKNNQKQLDDADNCIKSIEKGIVIKNKQHSHLIEDSKNSKLNKGGAGKKDEKKGNGGSTKKDISQVKEQGIEEEKPKKDNIGLMKKTLDNQRLKRLNTIKEYLLEALIYLHSNNISLKTYFKASPFPPKPMFALDSDELFEKVKFDKKDDVAKILNSNSNLLYERDHFKQTVLHWAAKRGYKEITEKILSKGKCTNLLDMNKRTPLYLAALNGHVSVVELLLKNTSPQQTNPFLKSRENKTPLEAIKDFTGETFQQIKALLGDYVDKTQHIANKKKHFTEKVKPFHSDYYGSELEESKPTESVAK